MILPPLPVAVPLLVAAALAATSSLPGVGRRRVADTVAIATAAAVTVMCVLLLLQAAGAPIVYWFGGWRPRHGVALGISFAIDPFGAGMAALAALLVTASLVFSWRYFVEIGNLYHVLMLVFLAAMAGFCLTGDLFDMFVFFELMGVAAFALTGYKIEEGGPLQGALNFAVTNSIAALVILSGVGLLYGRTGALNLAQIGHTLAAQPAGGLVIVAFVLITAGFFVKAAVVPFHFWLADAHAVAPTPVCVLFSGVMVELGLYAVARIYWTVFAGVLGAHETALRTVLVAAGVLTALLGAVMCPLQQHLKRLLAFSTVSHVGVFLLGIALLTPLGLTGTAIYVLGHALTKGTLFLCTGIVIHRFESVDIGHLHGRGRAIPYTGALFAVAGLALASVPPFGMSPGKGLIEDAAASAGYPWITVVLIVVSVATGGAVLRAAGQVFLGWGPREEDQAAAQEGDQKEPETEQGRDKTPAVMYLPALALLVAAFVLGVLPGLGHRTEVAAAQFQNQSAYTAAVLGVHTAQGHVAPLEPADPTVSSVLTGLGSAAGAVAFALLALFRRRLPAVLRQTVGSLVAPVIAALRAIQSGHVGDYVAWLTVGVAAFGAACAAVLR